MGLGYLPKFTSQRKAIGGILRNIDNIWEHLNVEYKEHVVNHTKQTMNANPTAVDLSSISLGTTGGSSADIDKMGRDGDQIRVKTINIKGLVTANPTSTNEVTAHVMLVKHYDNFLGDSLAHRNFFDEYSSDNYLLMQRETNKTSTHRIISQRRIKISKYGQDGDTQMFNIYVNFKRNQPSRIKWEGPAHNSPNNGKYWLLWVIDDYTAANTPNMSFSSKLTFIDN